MSTIKKLLALVLALTMVLSVSAVAAYSVVPYGDAASINEDCEMAVEMLYNLGIMKGDNKGNFNPEATITRAEVAKMIYVVLNYGEDDLAKNYTGAKIFSDVEAGLWYEGYINYAATTKLVQGRPDGTFGPNDPITCAEAAKMLLTAIGYSAEARGYTGAGWDKQVLADAAIIGLLDGYDYNTNTYAPRQWVAVMFVNALLDAYTYGTIAPVTFNGLLTGINYDKDYQTMGKKYFGLYEWSGVIDANEYAMLDKNDTLSAGQTNVGKYEFKGWTTDLTEIGEYRWGYACEKTGRDTVVYVGGHEDNTVFSTGMEVTDITSKSKIGGIRVNDDTKYFLNFEPVDKFTSTGNGDWLRVVHNDSDSTYAEYVFLTTFEMTEVTSVAKNDTVTLENGEKSDEFVMSEEVGSGDIVLYTQIEDKEYVELADSFTGKVDKYTYKTRTLTVAGEDYAQSDINYASIDEVYFGDLEEAAKKTEYTYYQDFFGNIRIFTRSKADSGELVLLTDAYFETNRNGNEAAVEAYIDGAITEVDVDWDTTYTDVDSFIAGASHRNKWGLLNEYWGDEWSVHTDADADGKWDLGEGAWTNIARTSTDDEGVMSLYSAQTQKYNAKGNAYAIKADYIDLTEKDAKAGQTAYDGEYVTYNTDGTEKARTPVTMQVTKNTVFYYVDSDLDIVAVTGYKNSFDVIDEYVGINAMYAVATDVAENDAEEHYWVADVVVIETEYPVFNLGKNVVLGYNVVNKTVSDYASLDVIGGDGALDNLNVTNYNGYNSFKATEIETPAFYYNTEDEDGDSHIRVIDTAKGYKDNGIVAGKVDMVNKLHDYIVLTAAEGTYYYDENTVIYDMYEGRRYTAVTDEDDYEDAFTFETSEEYILVADEDNNIIYAIWVADEYKADGTFVAYDTARALFNRITDPKAAADGDVLAEVGAALLAEIEKQNETAKVTLPTDVLADATTSIGVAGGSVKGWMAAVAANIEVATDVDAYVETVLKDVPAVAAQYLAAVKAAADAEVPVIEVETATVSVKGDVIYITADVEATAIEKAEAIEAALTAAGYTEIAGLTNTGDGYDGAITAKKGSITYTFKVASDLFAPDAYGNPNAGLVKYPVPARYSFNAVFSNKMSFAAGELSVVLVTADGAVAEAVLAKDYADVSGLTCPIYFDTTIESSSWDGNYVKETAVVTGAELYYNGVLLFECPLR